MGAHTAQQREWFADRFLKLAIKSIMPLIEKGKRDGADILQLLQMVKDDPARLALHIGELTGTHKIVEIEDLWLGILRSVGKTGDEWVSHLDGKGLRLGSSAKNILRSAAFSTTNGVAYDFVIIKGNQIPTKTRRTNKAIRALAKSRGYLTPPIEFAPLLRESITDREIEERKLIALIVMHEPVSAFGGLNLLGIRRLEGGWLDAYQGGGPQDTWSCDYGFVFLAPRNV